MYNEGGNYYFSYLLCYTYNKRFFIQSNVSNIINNKVEYIIRYEDFGGFKFISRNASMRFKLTLDL